MTTELFFDGACEWYNGKRNPGGIATFGWLIKQNDKRIAWGYGEVARGNGATNNIAEYHALIEGLKAAKDLGIFGDTEIQIKGDSQLAISQVKGEWRCNKAHLRNLRDEVRNLMNPVDTITWVPREQNQEADDLSKKAYQISLREKQSIWSERFRNGNT